MKYLYFIQYKTNVIVTVIYYILEVPDTDLLLSDAIEIIFDISAHSKPFGFSKTLFNLDLQVL